MHIQDKQIQNNSAIEALLSPEIQTMATPQAAAVEESDSLQRGHTEAGQPESSFQFTLTDILTPEILKKGGLEAAILLLLQHRGVMFETTMQSRLNDSKAGQERLLEQTKDRLETMRESLKEMDKAKKFGKASEALGWVGLAASGIALALTAGTATPLFLAASVGVFATTAALQIDSATGGNMIKTVAGDSQKAQIGVTIGISVLLLVASFGMAAAAAMSTGSRGAAHLGKFGKLLSRGGGANTGATTAGGVDDVAQAANVAHTTNHTGKASQVAGKNSRLMSQHEAFEKGDHWSQKLSQSFVSGLAVTGSVTTVRGAHAQFNATKLSALSMEMRAIEKRLSTYMDFIGQVIEDILAQIQGGNKNLAKQLELAFDPKVAILANV